MATPMPDSTKPALRTTLPNAQPTVPFGALKTGSQKQMRWWQSIRWQLALGSVLLVFLVTFLIALVVFLTVVSSYGSDQRAQLSDTGGNLAQRLGVAYAENGGNLALASRSVLPATANGTAQNGDYLIIVLNRRGQSVYPVVGKPAIAAVLIAGADPAMNSIDINKVRQAFVAGERGTQTEAELSTGSSGPAATSRPFLVQPIREGGFSAAPVVGVLFMTPYSAIQGTVPPFIASVTRSIIIGSIIVAVFAALAAILFSRTITRPLAKLTQTARKLEAGDYSAQVKTNAGGELGELATAFNAMAKRLADDVNELRQQELWRRELIMNITHDLATPLTAIAGLGESLMDGVNQSREDYEATGRVIVRETLRLRRLVRDLHLMAKVEAQAMHPQRRPVRLATLVDEVLAVLTPEFERVNVEPRNAIPYNLPLVEADPDMLMRVFANLCDNALRHMPSGGVVAIDAIQHDNVLLVAVSDTGEGIPTSALPRIFERFYRADSARQANTGGSGLGLAIVRAIVEAHGGVIWAENNESGGARIIFTLPLGHFDDEITLKLR
ncbi:MAG TPA: HAMP domain-containing sensor histidine kinase [Ktedonobacteraceae bacterium]|nr:HAMP domain-containing sensor histidine kinase [Ktedonobacteraceae bacterium]